MIAYITLKIKSRNIDEEAMDGYLKFLSNAIQSRIIQIDNHDNYTATFRVHIWDEVLQKNKITNTRDVLSKIKDILSDADENGCDRIADIDSEVSFEVIDKSVFELMRAA